MVRSTAAAMGLTMLGCGLHDVNNDHGGAINLALAGDHLVVARGTAGIDLVRVDSQALVAHLDPAGDADSYDDVSAEGSLIVAHDADDGLVASFRIDSGLVPVSRDLEVESGPYSGISMANGVAIVSGGTCGIARLSVGTGGELAVTGTLEAFRGQPDVTMWPALPTALLSTHFSGDSDEFVDGQEFGVTTLATDALAVVASAGLAGAGFSDGGGRPASWPVRASMIGELAFVAHGGGLELFRVAADRSLERLHHLDLPFQAVDVFADEMAVTAFVVGVEPAQIAVVELDADLVPALVRSIELGAAAPTAIAASADRIFVADSRAGLLVFER
jgi:hypothetical protein